MHDGVVTVDYGIDHMESVACGVSHERTPGCGSTSGLGLVLADHLRAARRRFHDGIGCLIQGLRVAARLLRAIKF
jgi:hypothetical protein